MRRKVKATQVKILILVAGIVVIGAGAFYLANVLTSFSGKSRTERLLAAGMDLFQKKQYAEAQQKLEKCYKEAPQGELKDRSLLFLSRCYTEQGNREKAIESWNKMTENSFMRSHHPEAFYSLASLRSAGGTDEERQGAGDYYKKAIAAAPKSRFAHLSEIALADRMVDRGGLVEAREVLEKLEAKKLEYPELRKASYKLNMKMLFSPIITTVPRSEYYVVREGDTLEAMSKRVGTTTDLLQESNRIGDPRMIQIGKRIKVITDKFRLEVSRSNNILKLMSGDVVLNEYRIGTGKFDSTPLGRFKITDKVKEPPWFRQGRVIPYGDPENVLGTRWMKLEIADGQKDLSGYGIHGTDDESSIGKQSSEGCIRLINRDVEELFKIVPLDTEVVITD